MCVLCCWCTQVMRLPGKVCVSSPYYVQHPVYRITFTYVHTRFKLFRTLYLPLTTTLYEQELLKPQLVITNKILPVLVGCIYQSCYYKMVSTLTGCVFPTTAYTAQYRSLTLTAYVTLHFVWWNVYVSIILLFRKGGIL
jgi:hypothetical protein